MVAVYDGNLAVRSITGQTVKYAMGRGVKIVGVGPFQKKIMNSSSRNGSELTRRLQNSQNTIRKYLRLDNTPRVNI